MANILIKQGKEIAGSNLVTPSSKADKTDLSSIIQTGTTSTQAISAGTYFYLNDVLVKAKVDIANGATFTLNTNYEVVTAGALNELNEKFNYSTTEHVVGKWIDGKTLYEKTISCGVLPSSPTTMSVAHGISNVDLWVEIKGVTSRYNKTGLPIPLVSNTALGEGISVVVDRTYIYITVQVNQSADINTFVTLRYTKA